MMKIAVDAREFENGKMTGIGRFLKNLLVNAGQYFEGFEFLLLGNELTEIPFELPPYCRLIKISAFSTQVWEQFKAREVLKDEKPDLFFSPYYKRPLFIDMPSVVTVHDLIPLFYPRHFAEPLILKKLLKLYAKKSAIITDSKNSVSDIEKHIGIDKEVLNVVYNAVDGDVFKPIDIKKNGIFSEIGINNKYIMYAGSFSAHKNVSALIKAYSLLSGKIKQEYELVICSNSKSKIPCGSGCIIVNSPKDSELAALYSGASLFVFPSLYEGFGLPPVEAMACGCPVLSSNASCMPEILGPAASYFNPLDEKELSFKIESLLCDKYELEKMSVKSIERARLYSKEKFCKSVFEVFKEAAGG